MQLLTSDVMQLLCDFYKKIENYFEITLKEGILYIRIWNPSSLENSVINGDKLDKDLIYNNYAKLSFIIELTQKIIKIIEELPY